jgi:hypothetical protein
MESARAADIWERLAAEPHGSLQAPTMFMAVPTIYMLLLQGKFLARAWAQARGLETDFCPTELESGKLAPQQRERAMRTLRGLRLMVSGSAALPYTLFKYGQR